MSKYFQEVFEKLCPLGRGTLSIKRDDSNDDVSEIFDVMTKVLVKLKIWSGYTDGCLLRSRSLRLVKQTKMYIAKQTIIFYDIDKYVWY